MKIEMRDKGDFVYPIEERTTTKKYPCPRCKGKGCSGCKSTGKISINERVYYVGEPTQIFAWTASWDEQHGLEVKYVCDNTNSYESNFIETEEKSAKYICKIRNKAEDI